MFTPTETVVLSFLYKADTGFFEISTQVKVIADDFNSLFNEIISCWFSAIEYSVDLTMKKEIESLSPNDFETKIYLLNDNQKLSLLIHYKIKKDQNTCTYKHSSLLKSR